MPAGPRLDPAQAICGEHACDSRGVGEVVGARREIAACVLGVCGSRLLRKRPGCLRDVTQEERPLGFVVRRRRVGRGRRRFFGGESGEGREDISDTCLKEVAVCVSYIIYIFLL